MENDADKDPWRHGDIHLGTFLESPLQSSGRTLLDASLPGRFVV